MGIPVHTVHIYKRPAQGTTFIKRHEAYNYQHTIANQGWFDTASCDLAMRSEGEALGILNTYLGCFVAVYVDNAAMPVWEGLINRIVFNAGTVSYTISLDEMANRVSVVYTGAANAAAETAIANNTLSQAIYGIKHEQIEFGADPSAGTHRTILANVIAAQLAYPQTAITQAQGQSNIIHLECIGIHHTLKWEKIFSGLTAATLTFTGYITALIGGLANGTTFFNNADLSKVATNGATTPVQQRGVSFWQKLLQIAEGGDGTNYWIVGITPTDRNRGTRLLYYQQANFAVEYTAFQKDGLRPRNAFGKIVPPWLVVPDRAIRVDDALVGFDSPIQDDPTETYIQSIQYDANSQRVQWFGADNTTARAAFLLNRYNLPLAKDFGAPKRVIST